MPVDEGRKSIHDHLCGRENLDYSKLSFELCPLGDDRATDGKRSWRKLDIEICVRMLQVSISSLDETQRCESLSETRNLVASHKIEIVGLMSVLGINRDGGTTGQDCSDTRFLQRLGYEGCQLQAAGGFAD